MAGHGHGHGHVTVNIHVTVTAAVTPSVTVVAYSTNCILLLFRIPVLSLLFCSYFLMYQVFVLLDHSIFTLSMLPFLSFVVFCIMQQSSFKPL